MTSTGRKNYRPWTSYEDAKLVEALVEMVNSGAFKADNGFKPGFLVHLEGVLKVSLPDAGFKTKPHIESRIKTLRNDWKTVYDMVNGSNTSGFGYDSVNRCGVVESPAVWTEYIKVHTNAIKWRNKPLPFYEDLCLVFGKDRAQRNRAQDFIEMQRDAEMEDQSLHLEDNDERVEIGAHNEEGSSARTRKRKSRVDPLIEGISNAATLLGKELREASTALAQSLNADVELQKKTSMVRSEISKIPSISRLDQFKASRKIIREPEVVLTFWNLEGDEREDFVKLMLDE